MPPHGKTPGAPVPSSAPAKVITPTGAPVTPGKSSGAPKKTTNPKIPTPPRFGAVYLQPQRIPGDTLESYQKRLTESEMAVAPKKAPSSPGSFTMLTLRKEKRDEREKPVTLASNRTLHEAPYAPGLGKVIFTGEPSFDNEIQDLENRKRDLVLKIQTEKNNYRIEKFKHEIADIDRAIPIFKRAAGMHYMEGKTDKAFYSHPIPQTDNDLLETLQWYSNLKARRETVKMGKEIQEARSKEVRQLKGLVQNLTTQLETVTRQYKDLQYETKKTLEGKMPEHVKGTLLRMEILLKNIQKAIEDEEPFDPPTNGSLGEMQELIDNLLRGNIFDEVAMREAAQEMITTHDILSDMLAQGEDITKDTLTARGINETEAEAVIELLKRQGILS